jgi:glycine cleavage system H lipoate-binding protein
MFPWVYEFHWSVGQVIFLGAFFAAVILIAVTVTRAFGRARRDMRSRNEEKIRWHSEFHDLTSDARACRHELTGEVQHRTCINEFDCRTCKTHPQYVTLRAKAPGTSSSAEETLFGLTMPSDRMYHRGHAWAHREEDGTFTVGLDDFGSRLVGIPDSVDLPALGTHVRTSGTGWSMTKNGSRLRVLAPIDGTVVEHGCAENGWFMRIRPDTPDVSTEHLLTGNEIYQWIRRELERLQIALSPAGSAARLADGGDLIQDVSAQMPAAEWEAVCGEMFLQP